VDSPLRIAFVAPLLTTLFARNVWFSLLESANHRGVRLTAVLGGGLELPKSMSPARNVYDLLDASNFDGVLLLTTALATGAANPFPEFLSELENLPAVSMGWPLDQIPSVDMDQAAAMRSVVRHLYHDHGIRRFVYVGGPIGDWEASARRDAFLAELSDLGVSLDTVREVAGDYDSGSGVRAVRSLGAESLVNTAMVCSNDETAWGVLEEAKKQGLLVPGQLLVAGFGDRDLSSIQEPSLTTVSLPLAALAEKALDLLVGRIRGRRGPAEVPLKPTPLYRSSCGCRTLLTETVPDKGTLIRSLLPPRDSASSATLEFLGHWLSDYLTAFEYVLTTQNPTALRLQWLQYYSQIRFEHERRLPLSKLFSGLRSIFGKEAGFETAMAENLALSGQAASRRSIETNQETRDFFFQLHQVELAIGQIHDRAGLSQLPFHELAKLGLHGLALVRFGVPPQLLYSVAPWAQDMVDDQDNDIEYPRLLPRRFDAEDSSGHRIVAALHAEQHYLGYVVFWMGETETFVGDFLVHQFASAVHRIELLERVQSQSQVLQESLDESKRIQEQLVETEKVASLGRLVAGVAHEVNTPLGTAITGASYLLDRLAEVRAQFAAGILAKSGLQNFLNQGQEALDGVLRNLMNAGELIQAFKGLGLDHVQAEWRLVDAGTLFGDLSTILRSEFLKRGVTLRAEIPAAGTMLLSQPSALVQVVSELVENAMQHAFTTMDVGPHEVLLQITIDSGALRIAVTDNGRGLTPDERKHIFEPLFTTKRAEGHSGLGLHLAYQLVNHTLKGKMTVASELGSGSCFLCVIPLRAGA